MTLERELHGFERQVAAGKETAFDECFFKYICHNHAEDDEEAQEAIIMQMTRILAKYGY